MLGEELPGGPPEPKPGMKSREKAAGKPRQKRILLVDDHPMTRYGLVAQLIKQEPDLLVCGEADNAQKAIEMMKSSAPDLVLADITMAGKSGLEFIKDAQALHRHVPVLILSMHDETIYAERVLRSGGRGYIMKSAGGRKVLNAVRRLLAGGVYVSEELSNVILEGVAGRRSRSGSSILSKLTDREFETFRLMGSGATTREIAAQLRISPKTVDTHRMHIKEKLDLSSLPELTKYALRWAAAQDQI